MKEKKYIVIGGSAGSFQTVLKVLEVLPKDYPHVIFLIMHRLKNVRKGFIEALSIKSKMQLLEPDDKDKILLENVYLAPANYHMYLEYDNTFSLSTEETVNHSRPSIDVSFFSAAFSFGSQVIGILLSGANKDGAAGLHAIKKAGGTTIVQDPNDSQIQTMPQAAINLFKPDKILTSEQIIDYLINIDYHD
ncbi:MAG: chemotaxis protein CheB [Bacteroidota bacterium]|nr:chemotaxis protein CheB [Bacteroidota bacterium]